MKQGHDPAQKERWGLDLLTLDKIGAWAITEPGSGSDAFGSHEVDGPPRRRRVPAQRHKTFITNGPYADTIVFICKLDEGNATAPDRKVLSFVLDTGMPGLEQSKPLPQDGPALLAHRRAVPHRRPGRQRPPARRDRGRRRRGGREAAKDTSRWSAPAWPPWRSASSSSASSCRCSTPRTACSSASRIGDFQLIQLKLAKHGGRPPQRAEPRVPPHRDVGGRARA